MRLRVNSFSCAAGSFQPNIFIIRNDLHALYYLPHAFRERIGPTAYRDPPEHPYVALSFPLPDLTLISGLFHLSQLDERSILTCCSFGRGRNSAR